MIVLRNVDVIKTGNAEIQNNIQHKGKIEQRKVKSEIFRMNWILPSHVNEDNVKRLDKQVQKKKKGKIGDEFFLHAILPWSGFPNSAWC